MSMKQLSRAQCMELVGSVPVGRVGTTSGALPVVLPVNFTLLDGNVIFRTVPGTKLDAAVTGMVVAFECDCYETNGLSGWSVLMQGIASEISDRSLLERLRAIPLASWALDRSADRVVSIEPAMVSGRSFLRPDTSDANTASEHPQRVLS